MVSRSHDHESRAYQGCHLRGIQRILGTWGSGETSQGAVTCQDWGTHQHQESWETSRDEGTC